MLHTDIGILFGISICDFARVPLTERANFLQFTMVVATSAEMYLAMDFYCQTTMKRIPAAFAKDSTATVFTSTRKPRSHTAIALNIREIYGI